MQPSAQPQPGFISSSSTAQPHGLSAVSSQIPARILVVDDEPVIVESLAEALSREGYQVSAQVDPLAALECLRRDRFSVIVSDQRMPGLTGLEFLAQARLLQPHASRILITGVLSLDTVIQSINKGEIYRFVVKPWLREEFLATIRDAVQRYELLSHNAALQTQTHASNRQLQAQIDQASVQNARLSRVNASLERNLRQSVQLLSEFIETFMPALGSQARRVQHLCRAMADVLQLIPADRHQLETSALLHDAGLLACSRSLIRRWHVDPSALTESEHSVLRRHPVLGSELLAQFEPLAGVSTLIRSHHERFDGTGYPDQLAGDAIPWLARVLAVAVGFAERNEPPAQAADWVKGHAGSAFDPEAVRVFCRALAHASVPRKELQLLPSELRPGMLPARGVYSVTGELIVPEGQPLTIGSIERVLRHERGDCPQPTLLVYC